MKKLVLFGGFMLVFLILCNTSVYAIRLGLSPGTIELNGKSGEKICKELMVTTDQNNLILYGEDNWTESKNSKDLKDYTKNSGNLKIKIEYPKTVVINSSGKNISLCITGEKSGKYKGIILYKAVTGVGVATWINLNLDNDGDGGILSVTGNAIKDNFLENALWPLLLSSFVSIIALVYLLRLNKRKSQKVSEEENQEIKNIEDSVKKE
ncbi:MAG TPA: hypothetical protein P5277_02235 [Candidatus Paceibacterota bacterium]|nr:hypothetical protein [Candidatus Paceibacterota bacterium]